MRKTWIAVAGLAAAVALALTPTAANAGGDGYHHPTPTPTPTTPTQPADVVTVVVSTPVVDCDADVVTTTTTTTTTPYVWNDHHHKWVPGTPTSVVTTQTRAATAQECPPTPPPTVPVPAQFSAEPTPPTCETAGSFSLGDPTPNVDLSLSPAYDGPGTYTLTATALNGYTFEDGTTVKTRTVIVEAQLETQSTDPEAPCFQATTPTPTPTPTATTPPTPAGNPPASTPPASTPATAPPMELAVTGAKFTPLFGIAGIALLLAGILLLDHRRRVARR